MHGTINCIYTAKIAINITTNHDNNNNHLRTFISRFHEAIEIYSCCSVVVAEQTLNSSSTIISVKALWEEREV
jgi:hypothetical protein